MTPLSSNSFHMPLLPWSMHSHKDEKLKQAEKMVLTEIAKNTTVTTLEQCLHLFNALITKALLQCERPCTELINNLAKEKAKAMGLCLLSNAVGTGAQYTAGTVKFLGGFAPFVYSDAGNSMKKNVLFTVDGCWILYDPKN